MEEQPVERKITVANLQWIFGADKADESTRTQFLSFTWAITSAR
jgi:hypothetical protein